MRSARVMTSALASAHAFSAAGAGRADGRSHRPGRPCSGCRSGSREAAVDQVEHLLGGDRGGDQLAGLGVVVQPFEPVGQPGRHARAGAAAKFVACLKFCTGMMPGTIGMSMPRRADPVEIAEEDVVIEEELGDRPVAPASTLAFSTSISASSDGLPDASPDRRRPRPRSRRCA